MDQSQIFRKETVTYKGKEFTVARANYDTRNGIAEYLANRAKEFLLRSRARSRLNGEPVSDADYRQEIQAVTDSYLAGGYSFGSEVASKAIFFSPEDDAFLEALWLTLSQNHKGLQKIEVRKMLDDEDVVGTGDDGQGNQVDHRARDKFMAAFIEVNRNPTTPAKPTDKGQETSSTSPGSAASSSATPTT